jgi:hypothetical protein
MEAMVMDKDFFINSINLVDFDGSYNVPTVVLYHKSSPPLFGLSALSIAQSHSEIIQDFKVDLGFIEPGSASVNRNFITPQGERKSAAGLTSDFVSMVFSRVRDWLLSQGLNTRVSVMLAEPLTLEGKLASSEWLSNYRGNLKRILGGERYKSVEFLPEPFAVFQYYRHGLRHPSVSGRGKQNVLIIDFGGGTFDVCIVETTKEGDISQTGRNSKPLGASSAPIGGYHINRNIAEYIIRKYCGTSNQNKTLIGKGLDLYKKWRRNDLDLSTLSVNYQNFICNFHDLSYKAEDTKIGITRNIFNWHLDAELSSSYPLSMPQDPFSSTQDYKTVKLTANEFKDIFIKIWNNELKPVIKQTISRGKSELQGAAISVILLSGGSSNIGWLRHLILRDFYEDLRNTEILTIPDYQEVVSKGLAVECVRRFHNKEGDFASVTYNRLCLLLESDGNGYEPKVFRPKTEGLPDLRNRPGVLLPSASILQNLIDKPMRWKVKLAKPPRYKLDYYFLRSSYDPEDTSNLHNVVDHTVYSPKGCQFDSATQVELLLKDDGTVYPKFIYKTGRTPEDSVHVCGKPFCLDMTSAASEEPLEAYIGFDFGTSNTSVSYVDQTSITLYKKRSVETSWIDLNSLVPKLPYPIALTLSSYLSSQSDEVKIFNKSRDLVETSLCLIGYIGYIEHCLRKGEKVTKLFKGYTQRSASPLWKLIKECLISLKSNALILKPVSLLTEGEYSTEFETAISFIAKSNHNKGDLESFNSLRIVKIIANVCNEIFSRYKFGYFANVKKNHFGKGFSGYFHLAHGPQSNFYDLYEYHGDSSFSEDEPILYGKEEGIAISLQPLIFWENCKNHPDLDNGHCYLYDIENRSGSFGFKSAGYTCELEVNKEGKFSALYEAIIGCKEKDPSINVYQIGKMSKIELD